MKKVIAIMTLVVCMMIGTTGMSSAFVLKAVADVAKSAGNSLGGGTSETKKTEITNSEIKNDVQMRESVSIGNSGISIKGGKIKISNSKIHNKVRLKDSTSVGNSGISIGN